MQTFYDPKDTSSKGLGVASATTISSDFLSEILKPILYGCKLRLVASGILRVVDGVGLDHPCRLTITLDSLAGSEKNDAGMNTGSTTKENTGGNDEGRNT